MTTGMEILDKYPIDNEKKRVPRVFIMPRLNFKNVEFSHMEIVTLGIISSLTKMKSGDNSHVETDFVNVDYLLAVAGLSRRYKTEIEDSIEGLIDKSIISEDRHDEIGMSFFAVHLTANNNAYMKINKDEFVMLCKVKNGKAKTNAIFMYILLNTYMFKSKDKPETFVTWVGNETISRIMGLSERTVQRTIQQLEDDKCIARYTVTMTKTNNFNRRHLISSYDDRYILREHVVRNLTTDDKTRMYGKVVG